MLGSTPALRIPPLREEGDIMILRLTCLLLATAMVLGGGVLASRAASSDDNTAARLEAVEKENALLRQENAALRERARLQAENVKLHKQLLGVEVSEVQPSSSASASVGGVPRRPLYMSAASASDAQPAAPANWTGLYIGGNLGYAWGGNQTLTFTTNDSPAGLAPFIGLPTPTSVGLSSSPVGGFQLGYNWQINQTWLVGFEADFDVANLNGAGSSTRTALNLAGNALLMSTADQQVNWFGTVRGRLGYLPTNELLVYGTGGFAYGKVGQSAAYSNLSGQTTPTLFGSICVGGTTCYSGTSERIATGWAAGGGLEYMVSNHWTIKGEYLYARLGANSFNENVLQFPGGTSTITAQSSDIPLQVVRGGANYKF